MWIQKYRVQEAVEDELGGSGMGAEDPGVGLDPSSPGDEPEAIPEPTTYLRDLTEDDVYSRLQQVSDFPQRMSAAESRMAGKMGPMAERLQGLEKSLATRAEVDLSKLKALDEYDPKLREALEQVLPGLLNSSPIDDATIRPFLDPLKEQMQDYVNRQLVSLMYPESRLSEIIPKVENDVFVPQGQVQEDFVAWLAQQNFATQESLQTLGPDYVREMQQFEKWHQGQQQERDKASKAKVSKLAGGGQPSAKGQQGGVPQKTAEELAQAEYDRYSKELRG